jgi:hypothetical protein
VSRCRLGRSVAGTFVEPDEPKPQPQAPPTVNDRAAEQARTADDATEIANAARPNATPVARTPATEQLPGAADGGSSQLLAFLHRRTPFMDLFCGTATRVRTETTPLAQVAAFRLAHHRMFWLCFTLDLLLRALVTLALVCVAVAVAWKTLAPLPGIW